MRVAVTGAKGFIGRNLLARMQAEGTYQVFPITRDDPWSQVAASLARADFVVHLAGANRPREEAQFQIDNVDFTAKLCDYLASHRPAPILFTSSIQAALDNPYGQSKRRAEEVIARYAQAVDVAALIFRLPNVFGKWCRPNYNSVVATFCHQIARDLEITVTDPERRLTLAYIDDVVDAFLKEMQKDPTPPGPRLCEVEVTHSITLQDLAAVIQSFRESRSTLRVPNQADPLIHKLYATYLSYLDPSDFAYDLEQGVDSRGSLAEFVKSESFGQIFVSRTKPGITRGDHYHHTKAEKFLVLEGEAVVRFRHIEDGCVIEYPVSGKDFRVIDIPPGYTHSIENVGNTDLVTLFWASEIFDPARPDTYRLPVLEPKANQANALS